MKLSIHLILIFLCGTSLSLRSQNTFKNSYQVAFTVLQNLEGVSVVESTSGFIIGSQLIYEQNKQAVVITKINKTGDLLWEKPLNIGEFDVLSQVDILSNSNIIAVGSSRKNTNSNYSAFAICLDQNGNIIWKQTYNNGLYSYLTSFSESTDGNIIASGQTRPLGQQFLDILLLKLNSGNGNVIGNTIFDGGGNEWSNEIVKSTNGFYLGSVTASGSSFVPGILEVTEDGLFIKHHTLQVNGNGGAYNIVNFSASRTLVTAIGPIASLNLSMLDLSTRKVIWSQEHSDLIGSKVESVKKGQGTNIIIAGGSANGNNARLIELSNAGVKLRSLNYKILEKNEFNAVKATSDGGYIAVGKTYNSSTPNKVALLVVKTDPTLTLSCCVTENGDYTSTKVDTKLISKELQLKNDQFTKAPIGEGFNTYIFKSDSCPNIGNYTINTQNKKRLCPGECVQLAVDNANPDSVLITWTLTIKNFPSTFTTPTVQFCNSNIQNNDTVFISVKIVDREQGCETNLTSLLTLVGNKDSLQNMAICQGDSVFLQGKFRKTQGTYTDTIASPTGDCPTILKTTLRINPYQTQNTTTSICQGDSVFLQGAFRKIQGTYTDTIAGSNGKCAILLKTTLSIKPYQTQNTTTSICQGDSVFLQGKYRKTPGTYTDTIAGTNGNCATILKTILSFKPDQIQNASATICQGDSIFLEKAFRYTAGVYFDTTQQAGTSCKTIIITELTVTPPPTINKTLSACEGDSILIDSIYHKKAGKFTAKTGTRCDTITITNVVFIPLKVTAKDTLICAGDSIKVGAFYYKTAGVYNDTVNGQPCKEIVRYNLIIRALTYSQINSKDSTLCSPTLSFSLNSLLLKSGTKNGTWTGIGNSIGTFSGSTFAAQNQNPGNYSFSYSERNACQIDTARVKITVNAKPTIGLTATKNICNTSNTLDLLSLLNGTPESGGIWKSTSIAQAGLPQGQANLNGLAAGVYDFYYQKPIVGCPKDSVLLRINLKKQVSPGSDLVKEICEGTPAFKLFTLLATSTDTSGIWIDSSPTGKLSIDGTLASVNLPASNYNFTYFISGSSICADTSAKLSLTIKPAPTPFINPLNAKVCMDSLVQIQLNFVGVGPFSSILSTSQFDKTYSFTASSVQYDTTLSSNTQFVIRDLIDHGNGCRALKTADTVITVYQPLEAILLEENCDGDLNTFSVKIAIEGGDSSSYRVNNIPINGTTYTLTGVQNGDNYTLDFTDDTQCSTSSIKESKFCKCISQAGKMDLTLREFCETENATGTLTQNGVLDADDVSVYVLHDKSGIALGNVLAYNSLPEFGFLPTMQYNKTYYISNVVTSEDLTNSLGFDPLDTCYSLSRGTPVRWLQLPNANLQGDTAICVEKSASLKFTLSGVGPFDVLVNDGVKDTLFSNINTKHIFTKQYLETTTYSIQSVNLSRIPSCVSSPVSSVTIGVNALPTAQINSSGVFCESTNPQLSVSFTGSPDFKFSYSLNGVLQSEETSTQFSANIPNSTAGNYQLVAVSDAHCDGRVNKSIVELKIAKKPVANANLDFSTCGYSVVLNALPSFGLGNWTELSGAARFAIPSNPNSLVSVPKAGKYTFVWSESNPPCPTSSDEITITFIDEPISDAGRDTAICGNSLVLNPIESVGNGTWIANYPSIISFEKPNTAQSRVTSNKPGTYPLIWIESVGNICTDSDTLLVRFTDSLSAKVDSVVCSADASIYTPYLSLAGGETFDYTVNGKAAIYNQYHASSFTSGSTYTFSINGNTLCGAIELSGSYTCPCISNAGTLLGDTLKLCAGQNAVVSENFDYSLDPNDTLVYILHNGTADSIGGILMSSKFNNFTFSSALQYNTYYYIARVVANSKVNSLGFDRFDRCFSASNSIAVIFNSPIQLVAASPQVFCEGEAYALQLNLKNEGNFTLAYTENGSNKTKLLTGNNQAIDITPQLGSNIYSLINLQAASLPKCVEFLPKTVVVLVKPKPVGNISVKAIACENERLAFNFEGNITDNLSWNFGDGETSESNLAYHSFANAGSYTVKLSLKGANGCTNEYARTTTIGALPKTNFTINGLNQPTELCIPTNINVLATNPDVLTRKFEINGQVNSTSNSFNSLIDLPETYTIKLTETSALGCTSNIQKTFKGVSLSGEIFTDKSIYCVGDRIAISSKTDTKTDSALLYVTNSPVVDTLGYVSNSYYSISKYPASGSISLKLALSNKLGCKSIIEKLVPVKFIAANFTMNGSNADTLERCLDKNERFDFVSTSTGEQSYAWTFSDFSHSNLQNPSGPSIKQAGIHPISLKVSENVANCSSTITKYLNIRKLPEIRVQSDGDTICALVPKPLQAFGAESYSWEPSGLFGGYGPNNKTTNFYADTLLENQHISFSTFGTDVFGCTNSINTRVYVSNLRPQNDQFIDTIITIGDTIAISLSKDPRYYYDWSPNYAAACKNCSEQRVYPNYGVYYDVLIRDRYACFTTKRGYNVLIDDKQSIDVPDAFTPNGDGINETIWPDGFGLGEVFTFQIFNNYGLKLHEAKGRLGESLAWDGSYKGKIQNPGLYYYTILVQTIGDGVVHKFTGEFLLIR